MLGAFPSQLIEQLIRNSSIVGASLDRLQPSSLDLTLSEEVYEIDGVLLPKFGEKISHVLEVANARPFSFERPLACKKVYICRLNEFLRLPRVVYAYANNKSSTGRINLQARLICEGNPRFDNIPKGYSGNLWVVLSPHSFQIKLSPGESVNQMRFFNADTRLRQEEHEALYSYQALLYHADGLPYNKEGVDFDPGGGITLTLDLDQDVVGYVAFSQPDKVLDYARKDHEASDFFTPMYRSKDGKLILNRDGFYIFSTKEYISVPPEFSVEMIAYDPTKGEFRTHYAGFFDPGFGYGMKGEVRGAPAVLEIYPHDHDLIFRDGQPICKMVYERLATFPDRVYGQSTLGSHYHAQRGPQLSKHFSGFVVEPQPQPSIEIL